jgi:hypothetical protein
MTKFNKLQNSFSSGELSPKLRGRTDIKEYFQGCEQLENFFILPSGGATRRPGTQYIGDDTLIGNSSKLIPFNYSKEDNYIVSLDLLAGVINWTVADGEGNGYNTGTMISYANPSESALSDINGWNYTQYGDALILTHRSGEFAPYIIKRTSATTFSGADFLSSYFSPAKYTVLSMPFRDINTSNITITPNGTTGNITLTASAALFDVTNHVNAYWRINNNDLTSGGIVRLVANVANSTTVFHATVLVTLPGTAGYYNWQESSWNNLRGYPRTSTIFEQRLGFGGNIAEPDTLWFSKVGNIWLMMQTQLGQDSASNASELGYFGGNTVSNPFSVTIASNEVNQITFLKGFSNLVIGTLGSEYTLSSDSFLSSTDVKIRKQTS